MIYFCQISTIFVVKIFLGSLTTIYIPEKRKFSGILCFRQQHSRRHTAAVCQNFVVSAIAFEGFKLRSSNLTHALLIQISRTSSISDIVVPSKMPDSSHFVKNFQKKKEVSYRSEMGRNAIESDFRTSKMAAGGQKILTVLYRSEMSRKANESDFWTPKMADRSEMARNAIESDFRTSKMATDLKWQEMRSKVNFGHFVKNLKNKSSVSI